MVSMLDFISRKKYQFRKELRRLSRWDSLRIFGKSSLVRSSFFWLAVVPVAAVILRQIENPVVVNIFGDERAIDLRLPFNWYCFYFSSLAFSIGVFLYNWKCPAICKFDCFSDFYQQGHGILRLLDLYYTDVAIPFYDQEHKKLEKKTSKLRNGELAYNYHALYSILKSMVTQCERSSGKKIDELIDDLKLQSDLSPIDVSELDTAKWFKKSEGQSFKVVDKVFKEHAHREESADVFMRISENASTRHVVARVITFILFALGTILILVVFFNGIQAVIETYRGDYITHPRPAAVEQPVVPPSL